MTVTLLRGSELRRLLPRIALAAAVGTVAAVMGLQFADAARAEGLLRPDFDHIWYAARVLWNGRDPYPLIGPGREFEWPFRLNYPLPALIVLFPIAWLPLTVARFFFVWAGFFALTMALTRDSYARTPILMSAAAYHAAVRGQWSPLFAAAYLTPALQWVYAAKPNIGGALWIARPRVLPIVAGLLLVAFAFLLAPHWLVEWLQSTRMTPFNAPVLLPGGFLILAVLIRWRRREARLVGALGCIPQTTVRYEAIYVMLACVTYREALTLTVLSHIATVASFVVPEPRRYLLSVAQTGTIVVWCTYLPAILLILRRPNVVDELR